MSDLSMIMLQLQQINQNLSRNCMMISRIESRMDQLNMSVEWLNQQLDQTMPLDQLNQQLGAAVADLNSSLHELMNSQETSTQTLISIQMNLMQHSNSLNDLRLLHPGQSQASPVSSCATLRSSPSGYYWVRVSNGSAVCVYCDMTKSCGGVTGGWMRVAELDTKTTVTGFRQRRDSNRRTCVSDVGPASTDCHQSTISTHNFIFSKVCGKIKAYQVGSTDAFSRPGSSPTIDNNYVDGISITHRNSPRQHIWTFAAGANRQPQPYTCPCIEGSSVTPPPFVGEDYSCETGNINNAGFNPHRLQFFQEPLWDGEGCEARSACCTFNTPPWFYKHLPQPTTDDIEMRVCTNEPRSTEDIAIEIIETYIQ
jgi:hypothetical protein